MRLVSRTSSAGVSRKPFRSRASGRGGLVFCAEACLVWFWFFWACGFADVRALLARLIADRPARAKLATSEWPPHPSFGHLLPKERRGHRGARRKKHNNAANSPSPLGGEGARP